MEFWGRSGPKDSTSMHWIYNDAWAKTADVEFLQKVKTLVTQVYTVDDLKRVEPKPTSNSRRIGSWESPEDFDFFCKARFQLFFNKNC